MEATLNNPGGRVKGDGVYVGRHPQNQSIEPCDLPAPCTHP